MASDGGLGYAAESSFVGYDRHLFVGSGVFYSKLNVSLNLVSLVNSEINCLDLSLW